MFNWSISIYSRPSLIRRSTIWQPHHPTRFLSWMDFSSTVLLLFQISVMRQFTFRHWHWFVRTNLPKHTKFQLFIQQYKNKYWISQRFKSVIAHTANFNDSITPVIILYIIAHLSLLFVEYIHLHTGLTSNTAKHCFKK